MSTYNGDLLSFDGKAQALVSGTRREPCFCRDLEPSVATLCVILDISRTFAIEKGIPS